MIRPIEDVSSAGAMRVTGCTRFVVVRQQSQRALRSWPQADRRNRGGALTEPLFPEKPRLRSRTGIGLPSVDQVVELFAIFAHRISLRDECRNSRPSALQARTKVCNPTAERCRRLLERHRSAVAIAAARGSPRRQAQAFCRRCGDPSIHQSLFNSRNFFVSCSISCCCPRTISSQRRFSSGSCNVAC
jgi:hypothetical protein